MRPVFDAQKLESGASSLAAAKNVISRGEGLKRQLEQAKNAGQAGALAVNVQRLLSDRDIWPFLIRDAYAAALSTGPSAEVQATDAESFAKIPAAERKLINIRDLSGVYAFNAETKKRTIAVTMNVDFVNMDGKAVTALDTSVGGWLRTNLDRKGIPYVIEKDSIKTTASGQPIAVIGDVSKPDAGAAAGDPAGAQGDGGSTASGAPSGGDATGAGAPASGAPADGGAASGVRSGRKGRDRGSQVKGSQGMSGKGGASLGGPPPTDGASEAARTEAVPEASADAGAAAASEAAQKGQGNLDSLAPILDPSPLYPPGTKIYSGEVKFTVQIRDGAAKPDEAAAASADAGAKP
jgi:hypothetical protein